MCVGSRELARAHTVLVATTHSQGRPRVIFRFTRGERPKIEGGGGPGIQYLVSLQWPVVQLDFSDGMHMTENSDMPQSARMRAQIQANTGNFACQRFSLHGVDLTKIDGGGARENQVSTWMPLQAAYSCRCWCGRMGGAPGWLAS